MGLSEQDLLTITANFPVPPGSELARLSLNTDPTIVQNDLAREVLGILRDLPTPAARHHARAAARRSDRTASRARHRRRTQCGSGRPLAC